MRAAATIDSILGAPLVAAPRRDEPRIEPRAAGWFLVYGGSRGPVGAFGLEAARRKLAEAERAERFVVRL